MIPESGPSSASRIRCPKQLRPKEKWLGRGPERDSSHSPGLLRIGRRDERSLKTRCCPRVDRLSGKHDGRWVAFHHPEPACQRPQSRSVLTHVEAEVLLSDAKDLLNKGPSKLSLYQNNKPREDDVITSSGLTSKPFPGYIGILLSSFLRMLISSMFSGSTSYKAAR